MHSCARRLWLSSKVRQFLQKADLLKSRSRLLSPRKLLAREAAEIKHNSGPTSAVQALDQQRKKMRNNAKQCETMRDYGPHEQIPSQIPSQSEGHLLAVELKETEHHLPKRERTWRRPRGRHNQKKQPLMALHERLRCLWKISPQSSLSICQKIKVYCRASGQFQELRAAWQGPQGPQGPQGHKGQNQGLAAARTAPGPPWPSALHRGSHPPGGHGIPASPTGPLCQLKNASAFPETWSSP